MALTASSRIKMAAENPHLFSHCSPGFGGGKPDCENCKGSYATWFPSAAGPAGTVIRCQHSCHGEVPEAWPGRNARVAAELQEAPGDENDDEPGNPSDVESEAPRETPDDRRTTLEPRPQSAPASAGRVEPPALDGEARRIRYLEGWVVKIVQDGKVEWTALNLAGQVVGTEWSLKDAKSLIGAR